MKTNCLYRGGIVLLWILLAAGCADRADAAQPLGFNPPTLPNGMAGAAYSVSLIPRGGSGAYSGFSLVGGTLPSGLSLVPDPANPPNWLIQGTPIQLADASTLTVRLTDSLNATTERTYSLTIEGCGFSGASTGSGAIAFGSINPNAGVTLNGTITQIPFFCTLGTAFTVTPVPPGILSMKSASTGGVMSYTLTYLSSGTGAGVGAAPFGLLTDASMQKTAYENADGATDYANDTATNLTIGWTTPAPGGSIVASLPINSVTAVINDICVVTSTPGSLFLAFNIDPMAPTATAVRSGADLTVQCTFNAQISITTTKKCGGLSENGSACSAGDYVIPYDFTFTTGLTGQGFASTPISMGIGATTDYSRYKDAPVGNNYADVLTVTVSP